MEQISQSLDVGEDLGKKEISEMGGPKESEDSAEKKENSEEKKVEKKMAQKSSRKKAQKKQNKKKEDDFDDDFDESSLSIYLFWIVVVALAALAALWVLTDWKVCLQF
jgi:hypothetical protein